MKKQTISRLAVGFLIAAIGFASISWCGITYRIKDHYSYLPSGEITLSELEAYDAFKVRDTFHLPSDKYVPVNFHLALKKKGDTVWNHFNVWRKVVVSRAKGYRLKSPIAPITYLHSICHDSSHLFGLGDSIKLHVYYERREYLRANLEEYPLSPYYRGSAAKTHVYRIADESLVQLKRERERRFQVYPSPTRENVNVRLKLSETNPGTIALLNTRGQILQENESFDVTQPTKFQLEPYPSGTYYIQVTFKGERFIRKIIKN